MVTKEALLFRIDYPPRSDRSGPAGSHDGRRRGLPLRELRGGGFALRLGFPRGPTPAGSTRLGTGSWRCYKSPGWSGIESPAIDRPRALFAESRAEP
jgi:hypothetical protein